MTSTRQIPICLICLLLTQPAVQGVLPLRDQWRAACHSLSTGQPEMALRQFREFESWYGGEESVIAAGFKRKKLRLWGLAALQVQQWQEGLSLLEEWLDLTDPDEPFRAFIRFQVAMAHRGLQQMTAAVHHWSSFLEEHPDLPECALVRWMWADLLLVQSKPVEAQRQLLLVLEEERLPSSGRALAAAAVSLINLSMGDQESALAQLQSRDGPVPPPLRLWRAILAPSLVAELMDEHPDDAVRVSQWFDRPQNLKTALPVFVAASERTPEGPRQAVWQQHWKNQLNRLDNGVTEIVGRENGLDALYQLRMRALLAAQQAEKALVLANFLLSSAKPYALRIRPRCYALAIQACIDLAWWGRADAFVSSFLEAFPEDPEMPDILFLQARLAAGRQDFARAIDRVIQLIEAYPEHPSGKAWRLSAAGWMLQAGRAEEALRQLRQVEESAPASWEPFLQFQKARCLDKLKQFAEAESLLDTVRQHAMASASLREQAFSTMLGLYLRQFKSPSFNRVLQAYRTTYPDGINRFNVENLAGTFARMMGETNRAVRIFSKVASASHPAAMHAREQLSLIYHDKEDFRALRQHALAWILQSLEEDTPLPVRPFDDCRAYQEYTGQAALTEALLESLLEEMYSANPHLPGVPLLEVMAGHWRTYSAYMGGLQSDCQSWVTDLSARFLGEENWLPYTHCQLFLGRQLEQMGRHDSADTSRIGILKSVDPSLLDQHALFTVALTADKYDFPQTESLLRSFLGKFPDSPLRPEILYRMAKRGRISPGPNPSGQLLQEIITNWPDAPIHRQACLLQAQWLVEDQSYTEAIELLETLLSATGLHPPLAAQALLLRARADFLAGHTGRGRLGCQRILALYPAFAEITTSAQALLDAHPTEIPHDDA